MSSEQKSNPYNEVIGIKRIQIRLTRFDYAKIIEMKDHGFIKNPTNFITKAVEKELEKKYKEFLTLLKKTERNEGII